MFDLQDRVIVVTGANGVLAGEVARYLLTQGARVVFIDRNEERLTAGLERLRREVSAKADGGVADVLHREQLDTVCAELLQRYGRIDALVNGAGGNLPGATVPDDKTIFDLNLEDYGKVVELNLQGTVLPSLVFGAAMARGGRGAIVNFSSMSAGPALTRVAGYSNAKAAVENFTRWMAVEVARKFGDGMRVNAIAPGFFIGNQNRALLLNEDGTPTARGAKVLAKTPMGRFGSADEVCGAVHFLLSDAAKFITGAVLPIDGGFSAFSGV